MGRDEGPLSRRSVWGVSPQVVESLLAEHERETAVYRARIGELESRVNTIMGQRDEAIRRSSAEHAAAHEKIAELESRLSTILAQTRASEEELTVLRESADRMKVLREEAVQVVSDAWTMAQAIEERTQQLVERTRTELMAEAAKNRAQFEEQKARHHAEMNRLSRQRLQMLMQLETTARGLLDHAMRVKEDKAGADFPSYLDLTLQSPDPLLTANGVLDVNTQPPSLPDTVADPDPSPTQGMEEDPGNATLLLNALDELEALLSAPEARTPNRVPVTKPGDELFHRLRGT